MVVECILHRNVKLTFKNILNLDYEITSWGKPLLIMFKGFEYCLAGK